MNIVYSHISTYLWPEAQIRLHSQTLVNALASFWKSQPRSKDLPSQHKLCLLRRANQYGFCLGSSRLLSRYCSRSAFHIQDFFFASKHGRTAEPYLDFSKSSWAPRAPCPWIQYPMSDNFLLSWDYLQKSERWSTDLSWSRDIPWWSKTWPARLWVPLPQDCLTYTNLVGK